MDLNPSKKEIKKSEVFTLKFKFEVMMSMGGVFLFQITPQKQRVPSCDQVSQHFPIINIRGVARQNQKGNPLIPSIV